MSFIYQGKEGWIKQAARNFQTFRSGLCLITLEYISRKSSVNYSDFYVGGILSEEDSRPCIDGAYIFPEPSYQDMGNGFVKCTVTAYGRVNTTGIIRITKRLGNYTITGPSGAIESQKIFDVISFNFVATKSEIVPIPTSPKPLIYNLDLTPLPIGNFSSAKFNFNQFYLTQVVDLYEVHSYGEFAEYGISISAAGGATQSNL